MDKGRLLREEATKYARGFDKDDFTHHLYGFAKSEAARQYHSQPKTDVEGLREKLDLLEKDLHKLYNSKCYLNPNNVFRDVIGLINYYKSVHVSESQPQKEESEWISVEDETPKLKTYYDENKLMMQSSIEVIVTDGITSWADYFTSDHGFHPSITHWQPLPKQPITNQ